MIPLGVKVVGGLVVVGSVIALAVSAAHAGEKPGGAKPSPKPGPAPKPTDALPADLQAKVQAAVTSGDPTQMRTEADELDHEGFKAQATALRAAADAVEKAEDAVQPTPPVPGPTPGPAPAPGPLPGPLPNPLDPSGGGGVLPPGPLPPLPGPLPGPFPPSPVPPAPPVSTAPVVHVLKGDGMQKIAIRILGNAGASRFHEIQHFNIPFDADGVARADDHAGNLKPVMNAGDRLLVPPDWVPLAKPGTVTIERVGVPHGALAGDGDVTEDLQIRRLAGRVASEVAHSPKGSENRELIAAYQRAESARGKRSSDCLGLYDAETVLSLATVHGIAPPLRFADGQEIYWAQNPAPEKHDLYVVLSRFAGADVARREEWLQSLAGLGYEAAA